MPICKLRQHEVPSLIDAHVIPRSFWEIEPSLPALLLTNTQNIFPKRSRIGVYDSAIVCNQCESYFNTCDNYAAHLLLNSTNNFEPVSDNVTGVVSGYLVRNFDYRSLKLFVVAMLWRASVASHSFFNRIQLGPLENKAREWILGINSTDPQEFGALFSIWEDAEWPMMMDPFPERLFGVLTYRFYLGRYVAYIKADQRPFPERFREGMLRPDRPLNLVSRALTRSKELALAKRIAQSHQPLLAGRFWPR